MRELIALGIRSFGVLHGGPLLAILEALAQSVADVMLVKHEAGAVFAADGRARATGLPGAAAVTSGPGATNTATACAVALRDGIPVFVVGATTPLCRQGMGAAQEMDTVGFMSAVTKEARLLTSPERARDVVRGLYRTMMEGRKGPVYLGLPADVAQLPTADEAPLERAAVIEAPPPAESALDSAADLLLSSPRVAFLAGRGTVQAEAGPALVALATALQAPVASTPGAKGAVPERSFALAVGPFGLAGSELARRVLARDAEVVIIVGTRMGEVSSAGWAAELHDKKIIRIDQDATAMDLIYRATVPVVGDARAALDGLRRRVITAHRRRRGAIRLPAPRGVRWLGPPVGRGRVPLHPQMAMDVISETLAAHPEEHTFVDIGTTMLWAVNRLVCERPTLHINFNFGSMSHALPAALGCARATGRRTWAVAGDAAFAQTCAELHTCAEYQLPVTVCVYNNGGNAMCKLGIEALGRAAPTAMFCRPIDVADLAAALGAASRLVRTSGQLRDALRWSRRVRGPAVLDIRVDADAVPPMGPRLRALSFDHRRPRD